MGLEITWTIPRGLLCKSQSKLVTYEGCPGTWHDKSRAPDHNYLDKGAGPFNSIGWHWAHTCAAQRALRVLGLFKEDSHVDYQT